LYVKQYIRPKYVVPINNEINDTIITASLPARMMEKCMFGGGLLVQILIDKYCDHLQLYRQMSPQKAGFKEQTLPLHNPH
jgi:transposase